MVVFAALAIGGVVAAAFFLGEGKGPDAPFEGAPRAKRVRSDAKMSPLSNEPERSSRAKNSSTDPEEPVFTTLHGDEKSLTSQLIACIAENNDDSALQILCLEKLRPYSLEPDELAVIACSGELDLQGMATLLTGMDSPQPEAFFEFCGELQSGCSAFRESNLLIGWMQVIGEQHPVWLSELEHGVDPSLIFDPSLGQAPVQLLEGLLGEGNSFAKHVLAEGGKGAWGGLPEQISRAAIISIVQLPKQESRLAYLEELISSPLYSENYGLGNDIAHFMIQSGAHSSPQRTVDGILRALDDPRIRLGVAAQMMGDCGDTAPGKISAEEWSRIVAVCRELLKES